MRRRCTLLRVVATCMVWLGSCVDARSPNLYQTLGLDTSIIDEKTLRSSYRKKAIETHPDKQQQQQQQDQQDDGSGTASMSSNRGNAEMAFQQVSEAYAMLKHKERSQDTVEDVYIPLNQILTKGTNIVVHYQRRTKVPCTACLGTGAPNGGSPSPTICPTCRGAGTSTLTWGCHAGQPCIHMSGTCGTCGGQGRIGQLCRVCRGVGIVEELREYTIEFPTGSLHHHTLRAVGEGDIANQSSRPGDLLFRLNVQPHPLFELMEGTNNLKTRIEMNIKKLRTSFAMQIEKLGGERQGFISFNVPSFPEMKQGETRTVTLTDFTDYGDLVLEMKAREEVWSFTSSTKS